MDNNPTQDYCEKATSFFIDSKHINSGEKYIPICLSLYPTNPNLLIISSLYLSEIGNQKAASSKAYEAYEFESDPYRKPKLLAFSAELALKAGDYTIARNRFSEAFDLSPNRYDYFAYYIESILMDKSYIDPDNKIESELKERVLPLIIEAARLAYLKTNNTTRFINLANSMVTKSGSSQEKIVLYHSIALMHLELKDFQKMEKNLLLMESLLADLDDNIKTENEIKRIRDIAQ